MWSEPEIEIENRKLKRSIKKISKKIDKFFLELNQIRKMEIPNSNLLSSTSKSSTREKSLWLV